MSDPTNQGDASAADATPGDPAAIIPATVQAWDLWATRGRGDTHWHIGERRWVELHGLPDPIVAVRVEAWTGDIRDPEVTHYGWEYTDQPGRITMVYPRTTGEQRLPWMFLNMRFAYGMQAEIDRGRGRMRALRITERTAP